MLIVEKLSRRPETFRRITGVDVELFKEIAEKIRPLWEKRRDNLEEGGETTVSTGMKTICWLAAVLPVLCNL